ncbi:MAG: hypothetical protein IT260_14095 [Saprospiraceae bacterium]|nr:hypothetical protein [Saprospiraceae bacterium]
MKTTLPSQMRRILRKLAYVFFLLGSTLGLLELAYRRQWIDFYVDELRGLNRPADLNPQDKRFTLLVLGDSFSAQPFSYVDVLRDSLPGLRIINAAVPGTGIREAAIIARARLQQVKPDALLYQVYVGNDLWDLRKSTDSPRISRLRNGYWRLSEYALFLRFLNYRLGQVKSKAGMAVESRELKLDLSFSPEGYSRRERMLFEAEPALVQHSVLATGRREEDLNDWLLHLDAVLEGLPDGVKTVFIVPVPHCAQVDEWYAGHMEQIGAASFPAEIQAQEYPFLNRIRAHYAHNALVRVCSPLPVFQQQDFSGRRLYFENDPHLNPAGQEVLGRYLLPELSSLYR